MSGESEGTSMMHLLAQRLPLTLILDLVSPPSARELLARDAATARRAPLAGGCYADPAPEASR
jgi:hypothetical protein